MSLVLKEINVLCFYKVCIFLESFKFYCGTKKVWIGPEQMKFTITSLKWDVLLSLFSERIFSNLQDDYIWFSMWHLQGGIILLIVTSDCGHFFF